MVQNPELMGISHMFRSAQQNLEKSNSYLDVVRYEFVKNIVAELIQQLREIGFFVKLGTIRKSINAIQINKTQVVFSNNVGEPKIISCIDAQEREDVFFLSSENLTQLFGLSFTVPELPVE